MATEKEGERKKERHLQGLLLEDEDERKEEEGPFPFLFPPFLSTLRKAGKAQPAVPKRQRLKRRVVEEGRKGRKGGCRRS